MCLSADSDTGHRSVGTPPQLQLLPRTELCLLGSWAAALRLLPAPPHWRHPCSCPVLVFSLCHGHMLAGLAAALQGSPSGNCHTVQPCRPPAVQAAPCHQASCRPLPCQTPLAQSAHLLRCKASPLTMCCHHCPHTGMQLLYYTCRTYAGICLPLLPSIRTELCLLHSLATALWMPPPRPHQEHRCIPWRLRSLQQASKCHLL